jgi:hypothetical protein
MNSIKCSKGACQTRHLLDTHLLDTFSYATGPHPSPPFTGGDPTPGGTKGWYAGGRILELENPNHQLGPNHHMLHQGKRGTPESDCVSPLEVQSGLIVKQSPGGTI